MEKEKSNKKFVYIAIIVMLLLFFFVFAFINRDKLKTETKEKEYDTVLIIGNTIFQKTNNYWNSVTNEENIIKLVNWKKYKIYTDYKYFGEYNLVNAETWLAFDDKRNPIEVKLWDYYLMYAMILGVAKEVEDQFKNLYPDDLEKDGYNSEYAMFYFMDVYFK